MKLSHVARLRLVVGVLGMASAIAQSPASAQVSTSANGPYYATPSWDQKVTTGRFVVLSNWNNEAVLDRETGLVWEQSPRTDSSDWGLASARCLQRNKGGRTGWRLPTIQELMSVVDQTVQFPGPTLPAGHPFTNVQGLNYWSATAVADSPNSAWIVQFQFGTTFINDKSALIDHSFHWCVRGGSGTDVQ
ncbi:MAG TPA: DUF1566 domain-containing protein [Burkholderiales bacterium]|nr:DUF1566 domain-containing protein [Burkholderiales bacterium]